MVSSDDWRRGYAAGVAGDTSRLSIDNYIVRYLREPDGKQADDLLHDLLRDEVIPIVQTAVQETTGISPKFQRNKDRVQGHSFRVETADHLFKLTLRRVSMQAMRRLRNLRNSVERAEIASFPQYIRNITSHAIRDQIFFTHPDAIKLRIKFCRLLDADERFARWHWGGGEVVGLPEWKFSRPRSSGRLDLLLVDPLESDSDRILRTDPHADSVFWLLRYINHPVRLNQLLCAYLLQNGLTIPGESDAIEEDSDAERRMPDAICRALRRKIRSEFGPTKTLLSDAEHEHCRRCPFCQEFRAQEEFLSQLFSQDVPSAADFYTWCSTNDCRHFWHALAMAVAGIAILFSIRGRFLPDDAFRICLQTWQWTIIGYLAYAFSRTGIGESWDLVRPSQVVRQFSVSFLVTLLLFFLEYTCFTVDAVINPSHGIVPITYITEMFSYFVVGAMFVCYYVLTYRTVSPRRGASRQDTTDTIHSIWNSHFLKVIIAVLCCVLAMTTIHIVYVKTAPDKSESIVYNHRSTGNNIAEQPTGNRRYDGMDKKASEKTDDPSKIYIHPPDKETAELYASVADGLIVSVIMSLLIARLASQALSIPPWMTIMLMIYAMIQPLQGFSSTKTLIWPILLSFALVSKVLLTAISAFVVATGRILYFIATLNAIERENEDINHDGYPEGYADWLRNNNVRRRPGSIINFGSAGPGTERD